MNFPHLSHHQRKTLDEKQQEIADNRRRIQEKIRACNHPNELTSKITELDLSEIIKGLGDGEFDSIDVLHAFQARALEVESHNLGGVCDFILEAEENAINIASWSPEMRQNSPLAGIPISVKENLMLRGYDCTLGQFKYALKPSEKTCSLVHTALNAGMIPFARSTTPQAMCSLSGDNPLFGTTANPFDAERIPGGSSSGEALLVATKASPIGIGSDILGSIRIPAAFCGLSGLKPTCGRVANKGRMEQLRLITLQIKPAYGPIGRKVEDLANFMRSILSTHMFRSNPRVPPMKFNENIYASTQPLKIGFYKSYDALNMPMVVPAVQRAVSLVVEKLTNKGHSLRPFKFSSVQTVIGLTWQDLFLDGAEQIKELFSEDKPLACNKAFVGLIRKPKWIKSLVSWSARLKGQKDVASMVENMKGASATKDIFTMMKMLQDALEDFDECWCKDGGLDALICPVTPYPAPKKSEQDEHTLRAVEYTAPYNLLDWPAGVVPVTFVTASDVENSLKRVSKLRHARDKLNKNIALRQKGTEGLPIAVQVVARPWREEVVLRVMREIEEEVGYWENENSKL